VTPNQRVTTLAEIRAVADRSRAEAARVLSDEDRAAIDRLVADAPPVPEHRMNRLIALYRPVTMAPARMRQGS
jgi:hypothetical protein